MQMHDLCRIPCISTARSGDLISALSLQPVEETQRFCNPQQLTRTISDHKGYCQHLTHSLSSRTHPNKETPDGPGGDEAVWKQSRDSQRGRTLREKQRSSRGQTMMQSRGIPPTYQVSHYPAVHHHHQLAWRREHKVTLLSLAFLVLVRLGAGVSRSIKCNLNRMMEIERMTKIKDGGRGEVCRGTDSAVKCSCTGDNNRILMNRAVITHSVQT